MRGNKQLQTNLNDIVQTEHINSYNKFKTLLIEFLKDPNKKTLILHKRGGFVG